MFKWFRIRAGARVLNSRLLPILGTVVIAACGQTATGVTSTSKPSPSPVVLGTATLYASNCVFDFPNRWPTGRVSFKLINKTTYTGRFILVQIHEGHSYQELMDHWNAGSPGGRPPFVTEYGVEDVQPDGSGALTASIDAGTYAFHCGYPKEDKVIAFWQGPLEAAR